jgi:hypothetical protein
MEVAEVLRRREREKGRCITKIKRSPPGRGMGWVGFINTICQKY